MATKKTKTKTSSKKSTKTKPAKSKKTAKSTKKAPRNGSALAAKSRSSGGPMKDRRAPKGGAKNTQAAFSIENDLSKLVSEDTQLPTEIANAVVANHDDTELDLI